MKPGRVVAVIVAILLALPAFAMLIGGAVLGIAYAVERSDDGYFDETLNRVASATAAITTGDVDLRADPGPPNWVIDMVDATVRIKARAEDSATPIFVGIASVDDIDAYLAGVAVDEITEIRPNGDIRYRTRQGSATVAAPTDQTFWAASATGTAQQELTWDLAEGEWAAVLMNADGAPGVVAEVTVGVRSPAILGIGIALVAIGAVLAAIAVAIIVVAVRRPREEIEPLAVPAHVPFGVEPVALNASLDEPLSPWLWLVKWFLAIPHIIVLAFLWVGFVIATFIAGVSILFTGRYPQGLFDFNLGVLRWTWRVSYYAFYGGIGTDQYPPFSLDREAEYPATLDIDYPERLSQGLVLVKWWLLAIPHYLVLGLLMGGATYGISQTTGRWDSYRAVWSSGLLGLLVLFAGAILLFTSRYPRGLFNLIIGLNRWAYRVAAYSALMTDRYPPFRLDQGGSEPTGGPPPPPTLDDSAPEFADRS